MSDSAITITSEVSAEMLAIITQTVSDAMQSPESKRKYTAALSEFIGWYAQQGAPGLSKAIVQRYISELRSHGASAASINLRRAAINKLVSEAQDNGVLDEQLAAGILRIKGERQEGVRTGNWLTRDQAQALIKTPDITTLKGLRDRALLAVAIGTGLRRSEIASLKFSQLQQREGRWVFADLIGKRKKVRTVPVPVWVYQGISEYAQAAGLSEGRIFRHINKSDKLAGESLSAQAVYDAIVANFERAREQEPALFAGTQRLAAHDTRRTFAKLARKGGAPIEQVSLTLGHASIATTERYLGASLDLAYAACDALDLRLLYC